MKVVLDHTKDEAANIQTFYFKPERPVHYTAGQFAEWTLKHPRPDDRGIKRWFTLSSAPTDQFVAITTKYAGVEKSSSFKRALFGLETGSELLMSDPMGDFVMPKLLQTPLIFVAGGIGITPFHSMLQWLAGTGEERPVRLLYGVRTEDEIIFQNTLSKIGVHATVVVGEPSSAWGGERGRLSAELILGLEAPVKDELIYVSGPELMVEALERDLKRAGLRKDQFVGDFFPNYSEI